jgi:CheY-like chemotaxis protein
MNQQEKFSALVVDDEYSVCEAVKAILETEGLDITTTTSSTEALKLIQTNHYDIIISDLKMPQMNGIELYEKIKDITDSIYIIITAMAQSHPQLMQ